MKHRGRKKVSNVQKIEKMAWSNGGWVMILMLVIGVITMGFLLIQLKALESGELGGFSGRSWLANLVEGGEDVGAENRAEEENDPDAGYHGNAENGEGADYPDGLYGTVQNGLPLICVDAGHGYDDPGAMHANLNGSDEEDITLDIALRVAENLRKKGYPVLMTRESDEIPEDMRPDERGLYILDPYERSDMANVGEADLFISIHCNSLLSDSAKRGMQLYYTENHTPDNPDYAGRLADSMESVFGERPQVIANPENDSFVVNRLVKAQSVLVETGFITNAADAKLMLSENWRQQMAEALTEGICTFLEAKKSV